MHVYTNSTILIYLIKIFNQSIGTYTEQQQKKELFGSEIGDATKQTQVIQQLWYFHKITHP